MDDVDRSPALAWEAGGTLRPLAGFWFLNLILVLMVVNQKKGFRPLAGFWFLNMVKAVRKRMDKFMVSVPLRGSGS